MYELPKHPLYDWRFFGLVISIVPQSQPIGPGGRRNFFLIVARFLTPRSPQFPQDNGPIAHPIRPESYIAMDNFYTATVYRKGAEVRLGSMSKSAKGRTRPLPTAIGLPRSSRLPV